MYCVLWHVHSLFQSEFSESVIWSFFFQFIVFSGSRKVVHFLPMTSSLSSFHFYPSLSLSCNNVFRRQILCKMWPMQLAFLVFVVCRMFLSSLTPCNTSTFHTMGNWQYTSLCLLYITVYLHFSLKISYTSLKHVPILTC